MSAATTLAGTRDAEVRPYCDATLVDWDAFLAMTLGEKDGCDLINSNRPSSTSFLPSYVTILIRKGGRREKGGGGRAEFS